MVCGRNGSVWWKDIDAEKRGRDFGYLGTGKCEANFGVASDLSSDQICEHGLMTVRSYD
jgi:hypothetical protein